MQSDHFRYDEKIKAMENPLYSTQSPSTVTSAFPTYESIFTMTQTFLKSILPSEAQILLANSGGNKEIEELSPDNPGWKFAHLNTLYDNQNNSTFNAAVSLFLLHFLADDGSKLTLLSQISHRLKKGSPFVLVTLSGDRTEPEFERQLAAWKIHLLKSAISPTEKVDLEGELESVRNLPLITQGRISQLLSQAGFEQQSLFYATYFCRGWVVVKS